MADDEMHNGGEVCAQSLKICTMTKCRPSWNGLKIDCMPCSLIETYPLRQCATNADCRLALWLAE